MKNRKTASQFFKDAEIVFKNDLEEIDSRVENFSEEWNIPIGNFFDINPVDRHDLNLKIQSGTLSDRELLFEAYYILARRKIKRFQKFVRRVCYSGDRDIIDDAVVMGLIDEKIRDAFLHTQEMIDEAWNKLISRHLYMKTGVGLKLRYSTAKGLIGSAIDSSNDTPERHAETLHVKF